MYDRDLNNYELEIHQTKFFGYFFSLVSAVEVG